MKEEALNTPLWHLDHLPIGITALDQDFIIRFWNSHLESWSDISRNQLVGKNFFEYFPHLNKPKYRQRFTSVFEGSPPAVFSSKLHRHLIPCPLPDGRDRIQQSVFSALPEKDGSRTIGLLSIQDVTDLTYRISDQKKANKLKDQVLAVCSHDLRAPLSGIIGYTELLLDEIEDPENKAYLTRTLNSAELMLAIIDDILILSKVKSSNKHYEDQVDCNQVAQKSYKLLERQAAGKGIEYHLIPYESPIVVLGDELDLTRVVNNLLSNALKFTPRQGRVTLKVDRDEDHAFFVVEDTGIGIDAEMIHLITQTFTKASRKGTEGEAGTGLGLSIVKGIINNHQGSLDIQSQSDKGSTFTITIPLFKG